MMPWRIPHYLDERFFHEWVAFGMLELAVYLTRHAQFAAYCVERDLRRTSGGRLA